MITAIALKAQSITTLLESDHKDNKSWNYVNNNNNNSNHNIITLQCHLNAMQCYNTNKLKSM